MTGSVVQFQKATTTTTVGGSATVTFTSPPTEGNLIVALLVVADGHSAGDPSAPAGYTNRFSSGHLDNLYYCGIWDKVAGAAESSSLTFTTPFADFLAVIAVELAGVPNFDKVQIGTVHNGTATTVTAPSLTPDAAAFGLAVGFTGAGNNSDYETASWSSGWTHLATTSKQSFSSGVTVTAAHVDLTGGVGSGDATATFSGTTGSQIGVQVAYISGTPTDNITPTLTATASLTAAPTPDRHPTVTLGATASLSAAPIPTRHAAPDLAAAASLTSHALTGTVLHPTLTATAALTTGLVREALIGPSLQADATLDTGLTPDRMLTVTLQALAMLNTATAGALTPTLLALASLSSTVTDVKPTIDGSILCDWGGLDVEIDTLPGTIDGTIAAEWGGLAIHATGATYTTTPPAIARPSFALYAADGQTWVANLPTAIGSWQEELNAPGSISFTIPLADAGVIDAGMIVKAYWQGACRMAARITSWTADLAVDGTRWRNYDTQPGILSLLGDGVVYPEYGFDRTSGDQRIFGAMSGLDRYTGNNETNTWFQPSVWHHPAGFTMGSDPGFRAGYYTSGAPAAMRDADPSWIAMSDPYELLPGNSVMWVRRRLINYGDDFDFQILVAADNTCTLWLDGQQILDPEPTAGAGWRTTRAVTGTLSNGLHMLAAKIINKGHSSRIAFACVVQRLDDHGNVADPAWDVTRKGHSGWAVNDGTGPPFWERANVIKTLIDENTALGVDGITRITADLPRGVDSTGQPWNHRGEYTFDVGTSVLDVTQQLCDEGMDVVLDPEDLTLRGYVRKGSDRSATVVLDLGSNAGADTENLKSYQVATTGPQWNTALMHLDDGTWVQSSDAGSVAEVGTRVQLLTLGSTADIQSATDAATAQFAQVAVTNRQVTAEPSVLLGALAYRDYQLGDTISVPTEDGTGHMKARVLAISVDATGDVVRAWPEFVEDPT